MSGSPVRILVLEGDGLDRDSVERALDQEAAAYELTITGTVAEATALLHKRGFELALLGHRQPDGFGLNVLREAQETPCIVAVPADDAARAVEAVRRGACDILVMDADEEFLTSLPGIVTSNLERAADLAARRGIDEELQATRESLEQVQDITEQQRTEKALTSERDLAQQYLDIAGVILVALDADGRVTMLNQQGCALLGFEEREVLGEDWFDLFIPEADRVQTRSVFNQIMGGRLEPVARYENPVVARDGREWLIAWHNTIVTDEGGRIVGTLSSGEDVTDQRQAEAELRASQERYRSLFDDTPDMIHMVDTEGRIIDVNPAELKRLGFSREELVGRPVLDIVHPQHREAVQAGIEHVLGGDSIQATETALVSKTGERVDVEVTGSPQLDGDRVISARAITRDISLRKRAEQREIRLARILEDSTNEIYVFDAHTLHFTQLNRGARRNLGYSIEELEKMTPVDLKPEFTEETFAAAIEPLRTGDETQIRFTTIHRRKDGSTYPVEVNLQLAGDGPDPVFVATILDITEHKKSEQALRESEEKYRDLVERAGVAIMVDDEAGRLRYFNRPFMELFGFREEELEGRTIWDLIHPEDLESVRDRHDRRFSNDPEAPASYSFRGVRKDRETIHLEVNTTTQVENNRVIGSRSFIRDVTDRKRLEEQLVQMQKLEALGQLAGGIAHDFNNLLMSISGSAEMLGFRFSSGDSETQELATIRETVARGAELTQRLLAIARQQVLEMEVTDLQPVVEKELKILRRVIPESIRIDYQPSADLPAVMADHGQLGQVLMNLVVNARDAMPEGGTITIGTESARVGGNQALRRPGVATGSYVNLSVKDAGEGMDAATLVRIFDPFYTSKGEGEGTGMGLATVYGIVKQHGGFIEVESAPGNGSTFDIYLPVTTEAAREKDDSGGHSVVGGAETILVVEDEPAVRSAVVGMLEALGYTVAEAADGSEALEALKSGTFADLVFSDVVMPRMGGQELLERVRKLTPYLPFLFSSGYTDQALRDQLDTERKTSFIAKPFTIKKLSRAVRQALSQENPE